MMPELRGRVKTLVLDLDDLLVHKEWTRKKGWTIYKRPGVQVGGWAHTHRLLHSRAAEFASLVKRSHIRKWEGDWTFLCCAHALNRQMTPSDVSTHHTIGCGCFGMSEELHVD